MAIKDPGELLVVMELIYILIVAVVTQLSTFIKTNRTVHCKGQVLHYKLDLNF